MEQGQCLSPTETGKAEPLDPGLRGQEKTRVLLAAGRRWATEAVTMVPAGLGLCPLAFCFPR